MRLRVIKAGVYSTVQDFGRPGHAAIGVPTGGAADRLSLALANRLVGNPDDAAAIEMTLVGATIAFEGGTRIALAGARPAGTLVHSVMDVEDGAVAPVGPFSGGARCYLAVAGGVDVPLVLGSRSTHAASGLGGHEGRALRALDVLSVGRPTAQRAASSSDDAILRVHAAATRKRLRVVRGAQAEWLGRDTLSGLLAGEFTVSDRSDRVGVRLVGDVSGSRPPLSPGGAAMITEPTMPGAIQIPPDGAPILLGPDAPVTGGYGVVATVIAADLPALGQLAPRERVSFELVTLGEALAAYRELKGLLDAAVEPASKDRR